MTISALSRAVHEDLGDAASSPALIACMEELSRSKSDLVGIAIGDSQVVEGFTADSLGIRDLEQRSTAFREFPDARYYLCREGKAKAVDRHAFFEALWLRVIESRKRGHS